MKPNSSELERKGNALAAEPGKPVVGETRGSKSPRVSPSLLHTSSCFHTSLPYPFPLLMERFQGSQGASQATPLAMKKILPVQGGCLGPDWPCAQHSSPGNQPGSKEGEMDVLQDKNSSYNVTPHGSYSPSMETSSSASK